MFEVFAGAAWIGSAHPFDLHEAYLCFRSPAEWLERRPERAELFITADSRYKLWINGEFVARGPARCYPERQAVDCLEVGAYLQPGANLVAVQVYQPGYSHFAYVHRAAAGLLAVLVVDGQALLVTAEAWRVRRDPSFASLVPRVSIYGSGVEERDLTLADDWTAPGYDDSAWSAPRVVAPVGGSPWTSLAPRGVPLLEERPAPLILLEARRGPYPQVENDDPHLALREGWLAANRGAAVADGDGWYPAVLGDGEAAYWLFDLGQDYPCQGWADVRQAAGTERLSISYAEKIRDNELVISDPQTYCRVRMTDRFRLRPGVQTAEPFALRGGRYLLFMVEGPTGTGFALRPRVTVSEYPLEIIRPLEVADPELAAIVTLGETTFRACLQDGFVDSTWRESSQWVGDALPQALIMAALSDDVRPLRQVIEMAAAGAYPDGVLPSVLPGEVHAYTVVDYNFMWVELLALYQRLTRDDSVLDALWPALVTMLARFHEDVNEDGLIMSQAGRRLFLDWAPVSRREPNAIYNLHYLLALQEAAWLGRQRRGDQEGVALDGQIVLWQERSGALQAAIRQSFWQEGRWVDDGEGTSFSQLAAALALLTGTARAEEANPLLDAIVARSLDPDDEPAPGRMVLASPFMHHYLFEALRRHGRNGEVVEIVRRRWGLWTRAGYPTAWENWSVDFPDGSQCHAFAAHPRYHLAEIAREEGWV